MHFHPRSLGPQVRLWLRTGTALQRVSLQNPDTSGLPQTETRIAVFSPNSQQFPTEVNCQYVLSTSVVVLRTVFDQPLEDLAWATSLGALDTLLA